MKSGNYKGFVHLFLVVVIVIIGIGGIIYYSWQKGLIKTTPSQKVSPTPTINLDRVANWRTYRNDKYLFEISYPDNWRLEEKSDYQAIALTTVTIYSPDKKTLLDIWVQNAKWEDTVQELESKAIKTKLNGIEALIQETDNSKIYILASKINGQIIQIITNKVSESKPEDVAKFDQILSTFEFID